MGFKRLSWKQVGFERLANSVLMDCGKSIFLKVTVARIERAGSLKYEMGSRVVAESSILTLVQILISGL